MKDDFITLVVHTPERASHLAGILSFHGIENRLVEVTGIPGMSKAPLKVEVPAGSLPLALRILESGEDYSSAQIMIKMAGMSGFLLIPVDFSPKSFSAVSIGFRLAAKLGLKPVILHAWLAPAFDDAQAEFEDAPEENLTDITQAEESVEISRLVNKKLHSFEADIRKKISDGEIPDIKFSSTLIEGVAEEVILEYCRLNSPSMVVMATRDRESKASDLIGSVAAEVVDSCRVPVITIPSNCGVNFDNIRNFVLFCSLDKNDVATMRSLMKSFNYPVCSVYLVPLSEKISDAQLAKLHELKSFFMNNYPTARFHEYIANREFCSDVDSLVSEHEIGLMIVPNKKSNVFSRIFKPTLAHRCLFQHDMPMLFIPV